MTAQLNHPTYEWTSTAAETAADLAGAAALLEIGDRLGLLAHLESGDSTTSAALAAATGLPAEGVANYIEALSSAGLAVDSGDGAQSVRLCADYRRIRYEAGYLSWALNANRPFIENAELFLRDPAQARRSHHRDGRQVAVSSEWMGSEGFYAAALGTILDAKPEHVVDLGAGTARLLIEVLNQVPTATATALDLSGPACVEAQRAGERAGVGDRLRVFERSIQSVATDPGPLAGADVIHAGFVFHDMMPEEEHVADAVLANCREALQPGGIMALTEAVPYLPNDRERRFSAIVTYYHRQFMGRRLLSVDEWTEKLTAAGFADVRVVQPRFPTGRVFVATKR
jgi:SAM-dependent methyltransferase